MGLSPFCHPELGSASMGQPTRCFWTLKQVQHDEKLVSALVSGALPLEAFWRWGYGPRERTE